MRTLCPLAHNPHCTILAKYGQIRTADRHGLTWVELIICIGIIAVLCAFLLPATRNARRAVRKLECLNNIRQIGIATFEVDPVF